MFKEIQGQKEKLVEQVEQQKDEIRSLNSISQRNQKLQKRLEDYQIL